MYREELAVIVSEVNPRQENLVRDCFHRRGHIVIVGDNIDHALSLTRTGYAGGMRQPNLLWLGATGQNRALGHLRELGKRIPVILTHEAFFHPELVEAMFDLGVWELLKRPFNADESRAAIARSEIKLGISR